MAGSLGPGETRARSLRPARQLTLHMLGPATSISGRGLDTVVLVLRGELFPSGETDRPSPEGVSGD